MSGIIDVLRSKPQGEELCYQLKQVKEAAIPLLAKITETFPDYTIHDIRHSEEVIGILEWLVPDNLKKSMNAYEIYFLIMSAFLHDIGMVDFPELLDKDFRNYLIKTKRKFPNIKDDEVKRMYIRENHQIRTEQFIEEHFRQLKIKDFFQAKIVGRICRGHRRADLTNRQLFNNREMYSAKNIPINVPLLAALLQIADELDLTFERAPIIVYETIKPNDPISIQEWEKSLSASGVGLDPENQRQIILKAICWKPKIYREFRRLETRIQSRLTALPDYCFQYRQFRESLPYAICADIEAVGFKALDFKFSLQQDQIVSLLMGEKLYEKKEDCLRELLQNAIDACRRKLFLEKDYRPEIVFQLSPDRDKIIVSDNGMGMDKYTIENYFTKIGKCFYTSPEFLEEGATFTPASQFGIGIVSCFMLANKIIIETKTDHSSPIEMEIDSLTDYFFVTDGKRKESGTRVTLILRDKLEEDFDLVGEIRYYARHTLPVRVITADGDFSITDRGYELDPKSVWDSNELKDSWLLKQIKDHTLVRIPIQEEAVEGQIGLVFRKDKELGVKPISRWRQVKHYPFYETYTPKNRIFLSNVGIFVNDIPDLAPRWLENGILGEINLKGSILDLNLSRNNVVRNEKFRELQRFLGGMIEDKIKKVFQRIQRKSINAGKDNLFARFIQMYLRLHVVVLGKPNPHILSQKIIEMIMEFYFFRCLRNRLPVYRTWNDLLVADQPVTLLRGYFPENVEYIAGIITDCSSLEWDDIYIFREGDCNMIKYLVGWGKEHGVPIKPLGKEKRLHSIVEYIEDKQVKDLGIFPSSWKAVKFTNYQSKRVFELVTDWSCCINIEHRFISLLLKNKSVFSPEGRRAIILGFFRQLRRRVTYKDFSQIQKEQKSILQWFKDAGIIENVNDYILPKDDFPPPYY